MFVDIDNITNHENAFIWKEPPISQIFKSTPSFLGEDHKRALTILI
jgi:hypothetical protein